MADYKNISDGTSDGVILFYMKNGKLHPIALTETQATFMDITLPAVFNDTKMILGNEPINHKWIKSYCV